MNRCVSRLFDLFGADVSEATGVLHVAAVCRSATGSLHAIRIGPEAPKSESDLLSLAAARARSDVILTSGQILRDEPDLEHTLPGPCGPELASWRREGLARPRPARTVVLTSGRDLDLAHPLFAGENRVSLLTGEAAAARLEEPGEARGVEVVARPEPGPRDVLAWCAEEKFQTVLVEFGPTSARALYESPVLIDELLLSVYEEELAPELVGPAFGTARSLEQTLGVPGPVSERIEDSGRWTFRRYRRDAV